MLLGKCDNALKYGILVFLVYACYYNGYLNWSGHCLSPLITLL